MPAVSVVLPTFNRASYLPDAIQSALNQTFEDLEILIVDDGSTDGTREAIRELTNDKRVKYISQDNAGAAAARNKGIALATGDYIAFLDSDDIWHEDKIEIELSVINRLPQVDIVCSDFSAIDPKDGHMEYSFIRSYFSVFDEYNLGYQNVFMNRLTKVVGPTWTVDTVHWGNIYETMLFGNVILTSTALFRKELFRNGVFDTRYETLEDYDLFLRFCKSHAVAFLDIPLITYRFNPIQLSGKSFAGKLHSNLIHIFNKNIAEIEHTEFYAKNRKKIQRRLGMYYSWRAYVHFVQEEMDLAAKHYMYSILKNPTNPTSYVYLLFALLPKTLTRMVRNLKSLSLQHN